MIYLQKNEIKSVSDNLTKLHVLLCFVFCVIGILLRLYRISQESVSLEEYACIANLNLDSIFHFIQEQRNTYPYGGILFPLLQYFWGKCFETGIVSLRLFSLFFWIAFYLMFWIVLGKLEKQDKLPPGTKIIVSIGIAFSPALIFIGQEARMYMTYLFFVWASFFLFIKVLENISDKKCVTGWILINQLLLWTHHIGVIIWCTEFLVLLIVYYKDRDLLKKSLFLLIAIHVLLLIPWFGWIFTIPPQPGELHRYYLKPSFWEFLSFPFALNLVGKGGICPIGVIQPWQYSTTWLGTFLHHSQKGFESALILFSVLGLLGLIHGCIRNGLKKDNSNLLPFLLLSFFIIPPLLLFCLARIGPPVFTTRYIVFLIPLHFIGLGYLLHQIRKVISTTFIVIQIIVLLYSIGVMTKSPWRMDWKGVGKIISENSGTQDLVILRDPFWMPILNINNRDIPIPITDAYTEEGLVELAKAYFLSWGRQRSKTAKVWFVIPDVYGTGLNTFPSLLDRQGFSFFVHVFPGEQKIYLYQVSSSQCLPHQDIFIVDIEMKKLIKKNFVKNNLLTEQFYKKHRYDHDRTAFHFIRCSIELAKHRKYKQAEYLLHYAWEQNPNQIIQAYETFSSTINFERECKIWGYTDSKEDLSALFWYGVKCYSEQDYQGALNYFSKLIERYEKEPLFWWFLAQTCDSLSEIENANWGWAMLFQIQPLLPFGWHFIYHPSAITCDRKAFESAFLRAKEMQIITEYIEKVIDYSLLK